MSEKATALFYVNTIQKCIIFEWIAYSDKAVYEEN